MQTCSKVSGAVFGLFAQPRHGTCTTTADALDILAERLERCNLT